MENTEGEAERGFEAGNAVGRALKLDFFFVACVGGVVGGEAVDGAVGEALEEGLAVGLRAQGRVHLGIGVEGDRSIRAAGADRLVGEREVVGSDLAGDVQAVSLGPADGVQGEGGGDVLHVQVRADAFGGEDVPDELDVAFDDAGFGFGGIAAQAEPEGHGAGVHDGTVREAGVLGVLRNGQAEAAGAQECGAHHGWIEDGLSVVGEAERSGRGEGLEVGEFRAPAAEGGGGHGEEAYGRIAGRVEHPGQGGGTVVDRQGVWHGHDGGEATGGGGAGSGGDGLLVGLAGFAEVDVDVDEAGRDNEAGSVDDLDFANLGKGSRLVDGKDEAIADEDVSRLVHAGGRVDDVAAGNNKVAHRAQSCTPNARTSNASRIARPLVTCCSMADAGESATSPSISSPRIMGPGCRTMACGARRARRSWVSWYRSM